MRFVLFAFLNRAFVAIQVFASGKALHSLRGQISVGHGVTNDDRLPTIFAKLCGHEPRNGTLAAAGSHRAHGNHGNDGFHLGASGTEEPEIRASRDAARGKMHHRGMGYIAIGKHNHVDAFALDHFFQIVFFHDGNPVGISAPSENRWITAASNVGNLRCSERDHMKLRMIAENDIEVMKISACGT